MVVGAGTGVAKNLRVFCKFCDTEFQKASHQLNIGRVTPGASASEGSCPSHYKIVYPESEAANASASAIKFRQRLLTEYIEMKG